MKTVIVWVLYLYTGSTVSGGGPAVIDNIASEQACLALKDAMKRRVSEGFCFPVEKLVP